MTQAERDKAIDAIAEYIYKSLNTPAARRTRFISALSEGQGVIKVKWDKDAKSS